MQRSSSFITQTLKKKGKKKTRQKDAASNSMHNEILGYPPHPTPPCPPSLQQLSPQRPPGRKVIRVSEAMSALKIQKAVNENLLVLYGKFSLGFDKKEKEGKTRRDGCPTPADPHVGDDVLNKKQRNKPKKPKPQKPDETNEQKMLEARRLKAGSSKPAHKKKNGGGH